MTQAVEERVEMKELLRKSGISAVDLQNWVYRGLLPHWCGRRIDGGGGSRYYYPAWAVERAADIKRLRDQGYTMQVIRKILRGEEVKLRCSSRTEARRAKRMLAGAKVEL